MIVVRDAPIGNNTAKKATNIMPMSQKRVLLHAVSVKVGKTAKFRKIILAIDGLNDYN